MEVSDQLPTQATLRLKPYVHVLHVPAILPCWYGWPVCLWPAVGTAYVAGETVHIRGVPQFSPNSHREVPNSFLIILGEFHSPVLIVIGKFHSSFIIILGEFHSSVLIFIRKFDSSFPIILGEFHSSVLTVVGKFHSSFLIILGEFHSSVLIVIRKFQFHS